MRDKHRVALLGMAGVALLWLGCNGGLNLGGEARVPEQERHVLADGAGAGQPLKLPADHAFSIHIKQSNQDPGATGTAVSKSDATGDGRAFAEAEASGGGSAAAEFKIGHRVDNHSDRSQAVALQVDFDLKESVEVSDIPQGHTSSKAGLYLAVVDSRGRVVSKNTILQANSDEGVGRITGPQQRHVTARLEPGESYDVVLYGKVEVATEATQGVSQKALSRIGIDQLKMSFNFAPIQTQPAKG